MIEELGTRSRSQSWREGPAPSSRSARRCTTLRRRRSKRKLGEARSNRSRAATSYAGQSYNSIGNIAEFFASRGKKFYRTESSDRRPDGKRGFRPGQKVNHPKYGEGTVYQREGEGEEAKITVQFPRFGLKKLVEKYAQLERG